jgi:hypothetical protein
MCLPRIEPIVTGRPGARFNVSRIVPPFETHFDLFRPISTYFKSKDFKPSQDQRDVLGQAREHLPASASIMHPPPSIIPGLLRNLAQCCAILTPPAKKFPVSPQAPAPFNLFQPVSNLIKVFQTKIFTPWSGAGISN